MSPIPYVIMEVYIKQIKIPVEKKKDKAKKKITDDCDTRNLPRALFPAAAIESRKLGRDTNYTRS